MVVCCSLNEPASSSNVCSSPPVAISNTRAVSTFVSCTECNFTICGESAHNNSIAISCRISFNVHWARRLRLKNLAAKLTPVCFCIARRTVANLPLFVESIADTKSGTHIKRTPKTHILWRRTKNVHENKKRERKRNMLLINFLLFHQFIDGIERLCLRQSRNKIKHVNTLSYGSRGKISTKKKLIRQRMLSMSFMEYCALIELISLNSSQIVWRFSII